MKSNETSKTAGAYVGKPLAIRKKVPSEALSPDRGTHGIQRYNAPCRELEVRQGTKVVGEVMFNALYIYIYVCLSVCNAMQCNAM